MNLHSILDTGAGFTLAYTSERITYVEKAHIGLVDTYKGKCRLLLKTYEQPIISNQDDDEAFKDIKGAHFIELSYEDIKSPVVNSAQELHNWIVARLLVASASASPDFYLEVSRGNVPGYSIVNKFGQNSALNSDTYEDVWCYGGLYPYPDLATAPITHIDSSDVNDTEPIEVTGLDIDGYEINQEVVLQGQTPVELPTPLWRVYRMKNTGINDLVGDVQATNAAESAVYAQIQNGNNQTLMALYTIPEGKTGYMIQGSNSLAGTSRAYAVGGRVCSREVGKVFQLKRTFGLQSDGSSTIAFEWLLPGKIPSRTDIRVKAISSIAGGVINTTFAILLVDK